MIFFGSNTVVDTFWHAIWSVSEGQSISFRDLVRSSVCSCFLINVMRLLGASSISHVCTVHSWSACSVEGGWNYPLISYFTFRFDNGCYNNEIYILVGIIVSFWKDTEEFYWTMATQWAIEMSGYRAYRVGRAHIFCFWNSQWFSHN